MQLIAGEWNGVRGPVESITGNFMSTLAIEAGASLAVDGLGGRNVFLYVVSGDVKVNGRDVSAHHLVELDTAGAKLAIEARTGARLLFGHGQPINEPVVSYGPFVMNTPDEIRRAIADYQAGRMGVIHG